MKLQSELDNRSLTTHTHTLAIANITNLQTELNNRSLTSHTHTLAISNITNLQTELNDRLLLTGGTLSGDLRVSRTTGNSIIQISTSDSATTAQVMLYFQHGTNSTCRVGTVGPTGATRPLELSTGWGGNMPIVARQYSGNNQWTTVHRELTLLDSSGNTTIPGNITIGGNIINSGLNDKFNIHEQKMISIIDLHMELQINFYKHTHSIHDIPNLQTELHNRSLTSHTHTLAISNITNLQTELENRLLLTGGT